MIELKYFELYEDNGTTKRTVGNAACLSVATQWKNENPTYRGYSSKSIFVSETWDEFENNLLRSKVDNMGLSALQKQLLRDAFQKGIL